MINGILSTSAKKWTSTNILNVKYVTLNNLAATLQKATEKIILGINKTINNVFKYKKIIKYYIHFLLPRYEAKLKAFAAYYMRNI